MLESNQVNTHSHTHTHTQHLTHTIPKQNKRKNPETENKHVL